MSATTPKITDINFQVTATGAAATVQVVDGGGVNLMEIVAGTSIVIGDTLVGVHDPAIGLSTNAKVTGDNAGTVIAHLRGINATLNGTAIIQGAGTAGTPAANILTVQGIDAMHPIRICGSDNNTVPSASDHSLIVAAQGYTADGQLIGGMPLLIAANSAGNVKTLTCGTAGFLNVVQNGNVTVIGTTVISSGTVNATVVGTAVISSGTVNATIVGTAVISGTPTVNVTQLNGTAVAVGNGASSTGTLRVAIASDNTANSNPFLVSIVPSTAQGWSKIRYAANGTSVQTVKGTAGELGGYFIYNPNSSAAYVQLFDVATGTAVTPGGTTPDLSFGIPATSAANIEFSNGVNFTNGIKLLCATTSTGGTNVSTGLDLNIYYK